MVSPFYRIFEQLLKEVDVKNVGLFPGKFKPPHAGHFKTCNQATKQNDIVLVLISSKEHEGITSEKSLEIWNIYKKYLQNIYPYIVTPTPVLACFDLANLINNGDFKASEKTSAPKSNAPEILNNNDVLKSYVSVGNNIKLNLYSSIEDQSRFKHIKKDIYKGKNIISIDFKPVARVTSASKLREALKTKKDITKFLPKELEDSDREQIINILNDNI